MHRNIQTSSDIYFCDFATHTNLPWHLHFFWCVVQNSNACLHFTQTIVYFEVQMCYGRILYLNRLPLHNLVELVDVSDMLYISGSLYILAH